MVPLTAAVCALAGFLVRRLPDSAPLRRGPVSPALLLVRVSVSALTVLTVTSIAHLQIGRAHV